MSPVFSGLGRALSVPPASSTTNWLGKRLEYFFSRFSYCSLVRDQSGALGNGSVFSISSR